MTSFIFTIYTSADAYQQSHALSPGADSSSGLNSATSALFYYTWEVKDSGVLTIQQHYHMKDLELDDRVRPYVVTVGPHWVSRLGNVKINHALITALVERWRQETQTFYLRVDEATVTLQDVTILLGLRIDGRPVTSHPTRDWRATNNYELRLHGSKSALELAVHLMPQMMSCANTLRHTF